MNNNTTNENNTNATDDLMSAVADPVPNGNEDNTEVDAHKRSVESGRLGAAMRRNNELQKEIEALKAEVQQLREKAPADGDEAMLNAEGTDIIDDDVKAGVANMIREKYKSLEAKQKAEMDELRKQLSAANEARAESGMKDTSNKAAAELEYKYPGFFARITRGDLADAWYKFKGSRDDATGLTYQETLHNTLSRGSVRGTIRVFEDFIAENNLAGQFGLSEYAEPNRTGNPALPRDSGDKTVYPSLDALRNEYDKVTKACDRGEITREQKLQRLAALDAARAQGRYLK